jgi:hypothetical protein
MTWIVYRVTCQPTGLHYIGATSATLKVRWIDHRSAAMTGKKKHALQQAIVEHGTKNFSFEVLYEAVDLREASAVERGLIAAYGTMWPNGYNMTSGGDWLKGTKRSPETCQKIGDAGRGKKRKPRTPEHQAKLTAARAGYRPTAETREKQRLAHLGKTTPPAVREKMSEAQRGRPMSPQELANLDWRGRSHTDEARQKMSLARRGVKRGPYKKHRP